MRTNKHEESFKLGDYAFLAYQSYNDNLFHEDQSLLHGHDTWKVKKYWGVRKTGKNNLLTDTYNTLIREFAGINYLFNLPRKERQRTFEAVVAILFHNETKDQWVLSFRGSHSISSWAMDFSEIATHALDWQNQNVCTVRTAIQGSIHCMNTQAQTGRGKLLYITGHSLGGWLAQISAFFCTTSIIKHPHFFAVTFDNPGAEYVIRDVAKHLIKNGATANAEAFIEESKKKIFQYLSFPNLINCFGPHIGNVINIRPRLGITDSVIYGNTVNPYQLLELHSMENIYKHIHSSSFHPYKIDTSAWPYYHQPAVEMSVVDDAKPLYYILNGADNAWKVTFAIPGALAIAIALSGYWMPVVMGYANRRNFMAAFKRLYNKIIYKAKNLEEVTNKLGNLRYIHQGGGNYSVEFKKTPKILPFPEKDLFKIKLGGLQSATRNFILHILNLQKTASLTAQKFQYLPYPRPIKTIWGMLSDATFDSHHNMLVVKRGTLNPTQFLTHLVKKIKKLPRNIISNTEEITLSSENYTIHPSHIQKRSQVFLTSWLTKGYHFYSINLTLLSAPIKNLISMFAKSTLLNGRLLIDAYNGDYIQDTPLKIIEQAQNPQHTNILLLIKKHLNQYLNKNAIHLTFFSQNTQTHLRLLLDRKYCLRMVDQTHFALYELAQRLRECQLNSDLLFVGYPVTNWTDFLLNIEYLSADLPNTQMLQTHLQKIQKTRYKLFWFLATIVLQGMIKRGLLSLAMTFMDKFLEKMNCSTKLPWFFNRMLISAIVLFTHRFLIKPTSNFLIMYNLFDPSDLRSGDNLLLSSTLGTIWWPTSNNPKQIAERAIQGQQPTPAILAELKTP